MGTIKNQPQGDVSGMENLSGLSSRTALLEYFVEVKILKGQTKTLYIRRNIYDSKRERMQL